MIKVLFLCHGNICRSPMAEYVFKDMVCKAHRESDFFIDSAATSTEEIGNPVHHGTRAKLRQAGISCGDHRARQLTREDYEMFDYLIGMDQWNIRNMMRILKDDPEGKVSRLLEFAGEDQDIADPWYTGNFDVTYEDICRGCEALLRKFFDEKRI